MAYNCSSKFEPKPQGKHINRSLTARLTPSEEWELKKNLKRRNLTALATNVIKSGWKIRLDLHDIKHSLSKSVNSYYLDVVASGSVEKVKALFDCAKADRSLNFNKNFINNRDYDALRIAIENNDTAMCRLLLKHRVDLRYNLFHAIEKNFVEGVEAILHYVPCKDLKITSHTYYFPIGLTPLLLAARNNNYEILKLLFSYGHRLKKTVNWWEGINYTLESTNERILMCTAKASPAYITLICEEDQVNPMDYCLALIKELRHNAGLEKEVCESYTQLENQVEDYMCGLLNQIQSSEELAQVFEYEFDAYWKAKSPLHVFGNGATSLTEAQSRLQILNQACENNMFKFVTHRNSQLALSYVRYRYLTFLKDKSFVKTIFLDAFFGLMYPVWSLFYLFAPWSRLGGIITLPNISYVSHLVSEVIFIALLIANIATRSPETDFLGSFPTTLEWLITLWILGKWVQEVRQIQSRGLVDFLRDWWNYIDVVQLVLFSVAIVLRIVDFFLHVYDTRHFHRINRSSAEPRIVSTGFLACAYVFVFLRVLSLSRTSRIIGLLQVSVAKMLVNVIQFFTIFGLITFAFALALTELFWYYGAPQSGFDCQPGLANCTIALSTIGLSLGELFWSLFGYLELSQVPYDERLAFVYWLGLILLGTYHVVAVIILINMLIAMMTKTFERTSQNKDVEWKFNRTVVWIRFIRRECTRPPPMNLLPNPYELFKLLRRLINWLKCVIFKRPVDVVPKDIITSLRFRMRRKQLGDDVEQQLRELASTAFTIEKNLRKLLSKRTLFTLMERYKFSVLLQESNRAHLSADGNQPRDHKTSTSAAKTFGDRKKATTVA